MADVNPPAFDTPVGMVRALIPDVELITNPARPGSGSEYIFSDGHLTAFLALNNSNVRMAAADACAALGTSEALILKIITTEDLATDGSKLMQQYLAREQALRKEALRLDKGENMDFVGTLPCISHPELSPYPVRYIDREWWW